MIETSYAHRYSLYKTMKNTAQLYLVLTKQWFTEILEGRKTEEFRDFTDFYINRLCELNEEGEIIDTKKYDQIGNRRNQKNKPDAAQGLAHVHGFLSVVGVDHQNKPY